MRGPPPRFGQLGIEVERSLRVVRANCLEALGVVAIALGVAAGADWLADRSNPGPWLTTLRVFVALWLGVAVVAAWNAVDSAREWWRLRRLAR